MLKLKEPLHLNSLKQLNRWNDSFENEILGKYELFPMSFHSEELLHLLKGEQEQDAVSGITQLIYNETYNENITLHIGILHQFINRMLALMEHRYTYNDYIYVSGFLTKAGIRNTTEFLENTYNYLRETNFVSASVHMEEQNQTILAYVYDQLAEYNHGKEKRQEQPVPEEKEFTIRNLEYVNHILNRVGVKQHMQMIRKFRESTCMVNDYSESAAYMELQNLTDLNELNYQTIAKTYALGGVTYCHINPYELPEEEKEPVVLEKTAGSENGKLVGENKMTSGNIFTNMIAAALCNITDSVYKVHITRKDGGEKKCRHEIMLDGADWSRKIYESSVRYVNNLLSSRNQWYFSFLRKQVYESGKSRLQMLDHMIRSVKIMKQKEVSDFRERNQVHRIKEAAAVQETVRSVLEQYTEYTEHTEHTKHTEMKEHETQTVQSGMPVNTVSLENAVHTILSEAEQHGVEQKIEQMMRVPAVSKIRKAVLQSFLGQKEEIRNFADFYVETDAEPQKDRQEEAGNFVDIYMEAGTEQQEDGSSSGLSEETREIFSLVQEYLMNPETVSHSGMITAGAAAMLHYDIHNQSELSVEEYRSYQERIVERTESAGRSAAEESREETVAERMSQERRYEYQREHMLEKETVLPERVINEWEPYIEAYLKEQYSVSALAAEMSDREDSLILQEKQEIIRQSILERTEPEVKMMYDSVLVPGAEIVYQREKGLGELAEMWERTEVSNFLTEFLRQHSSLFYDNREQQENHYAEQINHIYSVMQQNENLTKEENRQITFWLQMLEQSTDYRISQEDRTTIKQLTLNKMETVQQKQQLYKIFEKYENILIDNRIQQNSEHREQYELVWNNIQNLQNMSWPEQKNLSDVLEYIQKTGENITESEQVLLQKTLEKVHTDRMFHTDEVRLLLEKEILEQVYTEEGTYAGDVKFYVNNLTQEGSLSYVYSQETENQYMSAEENQYQNQSGSNTSYNKTVHQSVQWKESSINTENSNMLQVEQQNTVVNQNGREVIKQIRDSSTDRMERERIRTEMEHILETQINSISEKVYSRLERKLSSERKRRGY